MLLLIFTLSVGVPASMCLLGLLCFLCGKVKSYNSRRCHSIPEFNPEPKIIVTLDESTIVFIEVANIIETICAKK